MDSNTNNYEVFRECLSNSIVEQSEEKPAKTPKRKTKRTAKDERPPQPARTDPEELADFIDV